jgi:hypothetical protein
VSGQLGASDLSPEQQEKLNARMDELQSAIEAKDGWCVCLFVCLSVCLFVCFVWSLMCLLYDCWLALDRFVVIVVLVDFSVEGRKGARRLRREERNASHSHIHTHLPAHPILKPHQAPTYTLNHTNTHKHPHAHTHAGRSIACWSARWTRCAARPPTPWSIPCRAGSGAAWPSASSS